MDLQVARKMDGWIPPLGPYHYIFPIMTKSSNNTWNIYIPKPHGPHGKEMFQTTKQVKMIFWCSFGCQAVPNCESETTSCYHDLWSPEKRFFWSVVPLETCLFHPFPPSEPKHRILYKYHVQKENNLPVLFWRTIAIHQTKMGSLRGDDSSHLSYLMYISKSSPSQSASAGLLSHCPGLYLPHDSTYSIHGPTSLATVLIVVYEVALYPSTIWQFDTVSFGISRFLKGKPSMGIFPSLKTLSDTKRTGSYQNPWLIATSLAAMYELD